MDAMTLGGRERVLRYDLNAIAEIGDRLDVKLRIAHIGEDLLNTPLPLRAVRTILWAGVIHEDPTVTEQEVGAWVDQDNLEVVLRSFFDLFRGTSRDLQEKVQSKLNEVDADLNLAQTPS